jgi:tRNA (cmo5U34)-methyltransferase
MYVLMHLPDDGAKLRLLQGVARRLQPGAPLLLVDSLRDRREHFLPTWQRYAAARGMPADQLAAVFARIRANSTTATEARQRALLAEAGFREVVPFFAAFTIHGWVATQ